MIRPSVTFLYEAMGGAVRRESVSLSSATVGEDVAGEESGSNLPYLFLCNRKLFN
jgi:hypothetical protein